MNSCLECKCELTVKERQVSKDSYGVSLCERHQKLIEKLTGKHETPREAIQLFYGLRQAGASPMLEWWDGNKSVDIAMSRVKLNLEIDTEYQMFSSDQVLSTLEERMYAFKDGFTTIRIPHMLVRQHLSSTVEAILGIMAGLRVRSKAV